MICRCTILSLLARLNGTLSGCHAEFPQGIFDFDSSAVGVMAMLWAGNLDAAAKGGAYLLRLAELNDAAADRWYWMLDSQSGQVVTDESEYIPNGDYDYSREITDNEVRCPGRLKFGTPNPYDF
eukprot:SAG31_NODE_7572_length_1651_cov_0.978737_3_plen_124_part_00